jgi:hypothetical protein
LACRYEFGTNKQALLGFLLSLFLFSTFFVSKDFFKENKVKFSSDLILRELREFFKNAITVNENQKIGRGDNNWDMDQKMLSVNVAEHHLRTNRKFRLEKIKHSCGRLDRSDWNAQNYDMSKFCDIHGFHGDVYYKMDLMEKVYEKLFDQQTCSQINNYSKDFVKIKYYED